MQFCCCCNFLVLKPCYLCCPQIVRDTLQNDLKIMCKSSSVDLVTKTDQNVEQLIITSVKEKFPGHRYWVLHANTGSEVSKIEHIESKVKRIYHSLLLFVSVSLVKSQWLQENLVFWLKTQHGLLTLWMGPLTLCMGNVLKLFSLIQWGSKVSDHLWN